MYVFIKKFEFWNTPNFYYYYLFLAPNLVEFYDILILSNYYILKRSSWLNTHVNVR